MIMPIEIEQLHPLFVGEVRGLDLRQLVAELPIGELQSAIDKHAVLVLRGHTLEPEQQMAFAEAFGPLETSGIVRTGRKFRIDRKLADISNLDEDEQLLDPNDRRRMSNLGNLMWHTDSSFKRTPAKYSMLHAHVVPQEGGETQFVDTRAAYDALSDKMKAKIENLVAEHSIFASRAKAGFTDFSEEERAGLPPVRQRLVRSLPGLDRKTLYLASHASHIIDWPVPEGKCLLMDLMEHATQSQFIYTHHWQVGDLVMWDNRCTMHRGRPHDPQEKRDLRRATIEDDGPTVPAAAA
jgi:alpha-ketoglutarate-dependent 2,4-dichlorophenoxyacetate dioxygenase